MTEVVKDTKESKVKTAEQNVENKKKALTKANDAAHAAHQDVMTAQKELLAAESLVE